MKNNEEQEFIGVEARIEKFCQFRTSRYRHVYEKAFQTLCGIKKRNDEASGKSLCCFQKKKSSSEIYNIIPFFGGRGSGKTSAMLSFMECLKEKTFAKRAGADIWAADDLDQILFTCLDRIDCSLLEKGEDAFKIVIAQMYRKFSILEEKNCINKGSDYEYKRRKLLQKFGQVFRIIDDIEVSRMRSQETEWAGGSSMIQLKAMSNSLGLRQEFEGLVKDYLDLIQYKEEMPCNGGHMLVIAIDDIDLNILKGFEMLERVQRYMMIPRVIILISADFTQLRYLCEKDFYEQVPKIDTVVKNQAAHVEMLALDYLDKVLPVNYRIYLPMFGSKTERFGEKIIDAKKEIFKLFFRKLGIAFDHKGKKRHFYEADTLRRYVNIYLMLSEMKEPGAEGLSREERLDCLDANYDVILNDIVDRMAEEKLRYWAVRDIGSEQRKAMGRQDIGEWFRSVSKLELDQFFKEVVAFIGNVTTRNDLREILRYYGYSYGEMIRFIYYWGREGGSQNKKPIHCMIALGTARLTREYLRYRCSEKEEEKDASLRVLKDVLHGSVMGSMANDVILCERESLATQKSEHDKAGAREAVSLRSFDIYVLAEAEDKKKQIRMLAVFLMLLWKEGRDGTRAIQKMELKEERRETFGIEKDDLTDDTDGREWLRVEFEALENVSFNLFHFTANALEYEAVFKSLESMDGQKGFSPEDISSVQQEFDEWKEEYGGFALPFYHLDMTYNIIKRARRKHKEGLVPVRKEHVLRQYCGILENIRDQLKEHDIFYGLKGKESFEEAFCRCPFIEWLMEYGKFLPEDFRITFGDIINTVAGVIDPLKEESTEIGFDSSDM